MYTIEIDYITGDSFGSYDETATIGAVFENIDQAKIALDCIKDHYETIQKFSKTWTKKGLDKHKRDMRSKKWFVTSKWDYDGKYSIKVPLNDEEWTKISTFWIGHFERLLEARIVVYQPENLEDLKYNP